MLQAVMDNNGYAGADVGGGEGESVDAFRGHLVWNVDDFFPDPSEIAENDCSALDEGHQCLDMEINSSPELYLSVVNTLIPFQKVTSFGLALM